MADSRIPHASEEAERRFSECLLTDREREAVRSVLVGMSAEGAARAMGVGPSTVAEFRRRAYKKLGVSGARELVARYGEKDAAPARDWRPVLLARGLSATQADVLVLVAEGLSSAEIAERLHLAAGTVSSARANGYRLLGVHSREGLVAALEASEAAELERASAPRRRRAGRLAAACVTAVVLLAVLIAGGQAAASMPEDAGPSQTAPTEPVPAALTEASHTHGVVSLADVVADYRELGVTDVQVTRQGSVDEECCIVVEALSNGDPRVPDSLYAGATIYLTVTSDTTVPNVYDMTPIEATRTLEDAGLVPEPAFTSYHAPTGSHLMNEPRVNSMSVNPGEQACVGTTVSLSYDAPLDGYGL